MSSPKASIFLALLASWATAQEVSVPEPIVLPPPVIKAGGATSGSISLSLVSSKANEITDLDKWLARNNLKKPELYASFPALSRGTIPQGALESYRGHRLRAAFQATQRRIFLYGMPCTFVATTRTGFTGSGSWTDPRRRFTAETR